MLEQHQAGEHQGGEGTLPKRRIVGGAEVVEEESESRNMVAEQLLKFLGQVDELGE